MAVSFADEGQTQGSFQLSELSLQSIFDRLLPHDGVVLMWQPKHIALLETASLETDAVAEYDVLSDGIPPFGLPLVVLVEDLESAGQHEADKPILQFAQRFVVLVAFNLADEQEGLQQVAIQAVEDGVVEGEFGQYLLPDDVAHEVVSGVGQFEVAGQTRLQVVHGRLQGLVPAAVDGLLPLLQLHLAVLALEDVVFRLEQQPIPAEVDLAVFLAFGGGVETAFLFADVLAGGGGGTQSEVVGVFGGFGVVRTRGAALHAVIFSQTQDSKYQLAACQRTFTRRLDCRLYRGFDLGSARRISFWDWRRSLGRGEFRPYSVKSWLWFLRVERALAGVALPVRAWGVGSPYYSVSSCPWRMRQSMVLLRVFLMLSLSLRPPFSSSASIAYRLLALDPFPRVDPFPRPFSLSSASLAHRRVRVHSSSSTSCLPLLLKKGRTVQVRMSCRGSQFQSSTARLLSMRARAGWQRRLRWGERGRAWLRQTWSEATRRQAARQERAAGVS